MLAPIWFRHWSIRNQVIISITAFLSWARPQLTAKINKNKQSDFLIYEICHVFLDQKGWVNPQTARILTSHKGPTWAWEAQVLSHLYACNNQFDITYHVWFNKYKIKYDQYKWIWVEIDCTFFINDTKAIYAFKAQVGPLCDFQILAIWV